jgi:hypothetical protein
VDLQSRDPVALLPRLRRGDLHAAGEEEDAAGVSGRPSAAELLVTPEALLSTSHLAELGLSRRAIDAVLRELPNVYLPGYGRPLVKVVDYLGLVERSTYNGDRGVPIGSASAQTNARRRPL